MKYVESITDFFKSPQWVMNLLFAGLCVLSTMIVPVVGLMVLEGWLITGFWGRRDDRPESFPNFDFNLFGTYLQRGLWPVLVFLVASIVFAFVMGIVVMLPLFLIAMMLGSDHGGGILGALLGLVSMAVYTVSILGMTMVIVPLGLRAAITQDFAAAFNVGFVKRFVLVMWKELLICTLFVIVASLALMMAGMLAVCVGIFPASALTYYAWTHLSKQLYQLYLSRGGDPIPVSPKLAEGSVLA